MARVDLDPREHGFVVLKEVGDGHWQMLGEIRRPPGLAAKAARSRAIMEASGGTARSGETYAAVLRSEWRVATDWTPPDG